MLDFKHTKCLAFRQNALCSGKISKFTEFYLNRDSFLSFLLFSLCSGDPAIFSKLSNKENSFNSQSCDSTVRSTHVGKCAFFYMIYFLLLILCFFSVSLFHIEDEPKEFRQCNIENKLPLRTCSTLPI